MFRRMAIVALLAGAFTVPAVAAQADEPCTVFLHDHTPGVFPGGYHVHTDCLDK